MLDDRREPDAAEVNAAGEAAVKKPLRPGWFATTSAALLVVAVSIAFRLPSCGESFWLDELHSAWTVDGLFPEVAERAAVGNQTSGYFHFLWVWKLVFGSGERAMRASSILASSLTAAILVVALSRRSGRVYPGVLAGGIIAIDTNAIFFGCELRPYAFVMLYTTLALWSMMVWLDGSREQEVRNDLSREDVELRDRIVPVSRGGARWRLAMLFWICVAALIHPTSLGVTALLVPVAFLVAWNRGRLQLWRADSLAGIVVLATIVALGMSSLPDSWERRALWKSFGQATSWFQLWSVWSWWPIALLPIGSAVLGWLVARFVPSGSDPSGSDPSGSDPSGSDPSGSDSRSRHQSGRTAFGHATGQRLRVGLIPGVVGAAGTLLFFVLSYGDWIPLWHRRYFVAALPLLAWSAGELASFAGDRFADALQPKSATAARGIGWVLCGALLAFYLWYQGTLSTLCQYRLPLQLRGEAWREASELIRDRKQAGDRIWLDSQLIEADFLRHPVAASSALSDLQWEYLGFPLAGPYELDPVTPVSCGEHDSWIRRHLAALPDEETTVWLVSRSGFLASQGFIAQLHRHRPVVADRPFPGRPSVFRLGFADRSGRFAP